jgi:hypothetical protein
MIGEWKQMAIVFGHTVPGGQIAVGDRVTEGNDRMRGEMARQRGSVQTAT